MNFPRASQFSKFEGFQIFAKKLLYACDIHVYSKASSIVGEGSLRLGPLRSDVNIETTFDSQGVWQSFSLRASAKNYWISYHRDLDKGSLIMSSSSSAKDEEIPFSDRDWADPLLFVVDISQDKRAGKPLKTSYWTLSGSKWIQVLQHQGKFYRGERHMVSVVESPSLRIEVPKLRVSLDLLKIKK